MMSIPEIFRRHNFRRTGYGLVCGGFCFLLGACSTLSPGGNPEEAPVPKSASSNHTLHKEMATATMEVSYRPSPHRKTVIDLPEAMDYPVEENRPSVNDLEFAPEWTLTPEDAPPEDDFPPPPPHLTTPPPSPDTSEEFVWEWIDDMDRASIKLAIRKQLRVMEPSDLTRQVRIGKRMITRRQLVDTLHAFMDLLEQDLSEEEFTRSLNEQFETVTAGYPRAGRPALFTGYYTPIIPARRQRTEDYVFPLYRKPDWYPATRVAGQSKNISSIDSGFHVSENTGKVLLTRADIDGGNALRDQQLEVAWLKDDLERYFLHIQGSGYLAFPDGILQAVQYMASNQFPYRSIGRQMMQDGVIVPAQGSMQGIKQYFREHPEDIDKYLFRNHRYIFFQTSDSLPRGSGGAELVAGRSIATDKSLYPAGGLAYITVDKPVLNADLEITGWEKISRFVVDQDTGSAIKGPGRVDLYFGVGDPAGAAAGHYKRTGTLIYLLKK